MTSSTENLTERLRDRKSFRGTLEALADLYQTERGDRSSAKPARRETLQRYSLQARMLQATPRNSAVPFPESSALERILRRLGISSDSAFQPPEENGEPHILYEKKYHMLNYLHNMGTAVDSPLMPQMTPMDSASQLLSFSLHADSPFKRSLSNTDQERRLGALETQLGQVQKGIEGLNLDIFYQRDKAQDRFLERWL